VNAILAIPLSLRLLILFALGAAVGGLINLGVYRLAWYRRWLSPWTTPPEPNARRRWPDRVPVVGWWHLRREASLHGRGFWIRPMLVEVATGALLAGLYLWDVHWAEARVLLLGGPAPRPEFLSANLALVFHARFAAHAVLVCLMLVASLIDIDEKMIPDAITVSGTLAGLVLAVAYPWSLLPNADWAIHAPHEIEFLNVASPQPFPPELDGWPLIVAPAIAIGCWTLWCGGLLPRQWRTRRGLVTAVRVFVHRLRVEMLTYWIATMWLLGTLAIAFASWRAPVANWAGLLSALVGVAAGGGIVWVVRIVGTSALRREAMGFGDVTLMSMIGAFLGWQPAVLVFFLAPFFGLLVGLLQWALRGEHEIPYGPYLCLAALFVVVRWVPVWETAHAVFDTGWLLPAVLGCGMVMLGIMLWAYRLATDRRA
jgi:leader peptidase (prepilin peptidase) / N-methyltransferase